MNLGTASDILAPLAQHSHLHEASGLSVGDFGESVARTVGIRGEALSVSIRVDTLPDVRNK